MNRKAPLSKKVMKPVGVMVEPLPAETVTANLAVCDPEMLLGVTVKVVVVGAFVPGLTWKQPSIPFAALSQFESPLYETEGKQ